jgi:hypothetical protein
MDDGWLEEIGNRNRLVNLAGRNRFGGKKSAIEIDCSSILAGRNRQ